VLRSLENRGTRASHELSVRGAVLFDERDLGLATELVYGILRHRSVIDFHLERLAGRPKESIDTNLLAPLRVGLYQLLYLDRIPPFAAVNESVRIAASTEKPESTGFVNAVLRRAARDRSVLQPPAPVGESSAALALCHSMPEWIVARWLRRWGARETRALLEAFGRPSRPSLWVHQETREELAREMASAGIVSEPSRFLPGSLRILRGNPARTPYFAQGKGYLQDEASQAVPLLLGAGRGERVLDLCAAPGGKSFILASAVGPEGQVVAVDRDLSRLGVLRSNRDRLRFPWVHPVAADLQEKASPLLGLYSAILLDAPCTGTGTLGRRPEIRWRRNPRDLESLVERQLQLLERAADLLAPGGRLVYSVCSLEPEEGESIIEAFLHEHPDFALGDPGPWLPESLRHAVTEKGYFMTWPPRDNMDGFFAARLERHARAHVSP
jgi:16S rRNA (cytosine967-C5)-methyltransferase